MTHLAQLWPAVANEFANINVEMLVTDSRKVQSGCAFVALQGLQHDARTAIKTAISAGAVAVFADRGGDWLEDQIIAGAPVIVVDQLAQQLGHLAAKQLADPSAAMTVLAVTGTNGKTSIANLLAGACEVLARPTGVIGTLGNGRVGQLNASVFTTPDPIQLQSLLANFRDQGLSTVAMEASSHGLLQGRMNGTEIHTAIFTNLTRDHLDYHGDMASYAQAKGLLFSWPSLRYAVINADDPQGDVYAQQLAPRVVCWRYSLDAATQADITATNLSLSLDGIAMDVATPQGAGRLVSPLLGRFNASNLLAVLGGLLSINVALVDALAAIAQVPAVTGRMQCLRAMNSALAVIDYAHTPDALLHALQAAREHTRGRLWCVFGCGGGRDTGKRPEMGRIADELADVVVVTTDNPREEAPESILAHVVSGMAQQAELHVIADRAHAIHWALSQAQKNDLVLIAGKGHETYQEVQGVRYPFSDVEQVRKALALEATV
ncbi:MAG: UDP-N-acetylmuramoyl-L-alanyl-D-glutamate--2,6-diaminopimelate ligase [Moraxellaceae bacterium]|nr:UDP-N-acetylmuramoyl-L-alanyl-D-glutamate--2,6-diaminopimelate ligase [Moraxellaceae bacterium]